jgi:hypothetical protein
MIEYLKLDNNPEEKINMHFFALSQESNPTGQRRNPLPPNCGEFMTETLDMAQHTDNFQFTLYDNHIHEIFSKSPAYHYIINNGLRTAPISKVMESFEAFKSDPEFETMPDDLQESFLVNEQESKEEIPKIFARVTTAKKRIYEAMQEVHSEK